MSRNSVSLTSPSQLWLTPHMLYHRLQSPNMMVLLAFLMHFYLCSTRSTGLLDVLRELALALAVLRSV